MYYRHEYKALASMRQLTQFIVLDIEPLGPSVGRCVREGRGAVHGHGCPRCTVYSHVLRCVLDDAFGGRCKHELLSTA